MNKILELREKRAKAWDTAKAFLDTKRGTDGLISAEDSATYEKMEADVVNLGKEIDRLERQAALDAELSKPTADPLTGKPAAPTGEVKTGRASDAYKKAFWNAMRAKAPHYDVFNALQEGADSQYRSMTDLERNTSQATVCLNRANPGCSPDGTSILYMTTLFTDDVWGSVRPEDYYATKNRAAAAMISRFEEATGTHIREHIEEIAVATPETYARYCGHPQGVIYGYESLYRDGLMPRTIMADEDAFVPGLRIGGGYGERLLGYPSSFKSGVNEAGRTLRDMEKEGA